MGQRQTKRRVFFEENPICIFCGGTSQAVEQDHVPGRIFFRERKWPEGYIFPACEKCNRLTRLDEQKLAFIARLSEKEDTPINRKEIKDGINALKNNDMGAFLGLRTTANENRTLLKNLKRKLGPGESYAELPVVNLRDDHFKSSFEFYGFKLGAALHYHHTKISFFLTEAVWFT